MRTKVYSWLGREFVEISGEAPGAATVEEETRDLFRRFETELRALDLSLENTVRTRLWARTREARTLAAAERSKILGVRAKASSSSYVSQHHLDSNGNVALDLLAVRPSKPGAERSPVDFDPPRAYLRYLRCDSVLFVSGFTSSSDGLENQVSQILFDIEQTVEAAGADWNKVARLSAFLHRSQKLDLLKTFLAKGNKVRVPQVEFGTVDGFAGEKCLLEIEVTATT